jgi:hypothetical protein
MHTFREDKHNNNYEVGYYDEGIWFCLFTVSTLWDAIHAVSHLNGGDSRDWGVEVATSRD